MPDCRFISRAAVRALLVSSVPFILGFARSARIKARLVASSGQQRRRLQDYSAIRPGDCRWDERLRLFALGARATNDRRGRWVSVTSLRASGPSQLARTDLPAAPARRAGYR